MTTQPGEHISRLSLQANFISSPFRDECKELGIPASVGSFQQLYGLMENEIDKNPRKRNDYGKAYKMTPKEKQISFYNNYFIYKKVRNVDTRAVYNTMIGSSKLQEQMERLQEKEAVNASKKQEAEDKPRPPKKLKRKLILQMDSKE